MRRYNRLSASSAQLRLRVVVNVGEVRFDDQGVTGDDVLRTFRLLDSDALRERLRRLADEPLVLLVSQYVYESVIATDDCDLFSGDSFDEIRVDNKGMRISAWAHPRVPAEPRSRRSRLAAAVARLPALLSALSYALARALRWPRWALVGKLVLAVALWRIRACGRV